MATPLENGNAEHFVQGQKLGQDQKSSLLDSYGYAILSTRKPSWLSGKNARGSTLPTENSLEYWNNNFGDCGLSNPFQGLARNMKTQRKKQWGVIPFFNKREKIRGGNMGFLKNYMIAGS